MDKSSEQKGGFDVTTFKKSHILNILKDYKDLSSQEVINLVDNCFKNSEFKLNLIKDKSKGAKISDTKYI